MAIQKDPEHILTTLKLLKYRDDDLTLFTNCFSKFRIGDGNITIRQFDTVLSSDENDMVIFLQRDGLADSLDIVRYFNKRNTPYVIVNGSNNNSYVDDIETPELWFARDKRRIG